MNTLLRRTSLLLSVALILAAAVLAILAGQRYSARFDWTADQRHGLSTASQRVIDALDGPITVSYTHLRAHETLRYLVCRLLLEK